MVVTRPRITQITIAERLLIARRSGNGTQSFDGLRNVTAGDAVITMTSLPRYADETAGEQLRQMHAGRLCRDVRHEGQLSGRTRTSIEQGRQHGSARGIGDEGCRGSKREFTVHANRLPPNEPR